VHGEADSGGVARGLSDPLSPPRHQHVALDHVPNDPRSGEGELPPSIVPPLLKGEGARG